jgi:hypothetical protein
MNEVLSEVGHLDICHTTVRRFLQPILQGVAIEELLATFAAR